MINYLILAGALLVVFATIQLLQNIYIHRVVDEKDYHKGRTMAFWGVVISSTMIAIGVVIIAISIAAHLQVSKKAQKPFDSSKHAPSAPLITSKKSREASGVPKAPVVQQKVPPAPYVRPPPINPYRGTRGWAPSRVVRRSNTTRDPFRP